MNDLDAIRRTWLAQCGPCEFGVPGVCRFVIDALCSEVEALRRQRHDLWVEVLRRRAHHSEGPSK